MSSPEKCSVSVRHGTNPTKWTSNKLRMQQTLIYCKIKRNGAMCPPAKYIRNSSFYHRKKQFCDLIIGLQTDGCLLRGAEKALFSTFQTPVGWEGETKLVGDTLFLHKFLLPLSFCCNIWKTQISSLVP